MAGQKFWDVTAKSDCPVIAGKTFKRIAANNAFDAKMVVVMREWKHPFTGLTDKMTAKRSK